MISMEKAKSESTATSSNGGGPGSNERTGRSTTQLQRSPRRTGNKEKSDENSSSEKKKDSVCLLLSSVCFLFFFIHYDVIRERISKKRMKNQIIHRNQIKMGKMKRKTVKNQREVLQMAGKKMIRNAPLSQKLHLRNAD